MFSGFFINKAPTILVLSLLLTLLNILIIGSTSIGIAALFGFALSSAALLGSRFALDLVKRVVIGLLILSALTAILGSVVYYIAPVSTWTLMAVLVIISIMAIALNEPSKVTTGVSKINWALWCCLTVLLVSFFAILNSFVITQAVRSTWNVVDPNILLILFFATLATIVLLVKKGASAGIVFALSAIFFAGVSIAAIVYPLGLGFDPFIHKATIAHIAEFGTITPKPMYYIGQYALELLGTMIFFLPPVIDAFLVPVFASLFITSTAWIGFDALFQKKTIAVLSVVLLPLSAFTITTPQSLAYIFVASIIFLSLALMRESKAWIWGLLILLLAAALITHPLAGIPAALYLGLVWISKQNFAKPVKTAVLIILSAMSALVMPIVFILQSKLANLNITINPSGLFDLSNFQLSTFFANHSDSIFDALYLFSSNHVWIVLGLCLLGFFIIKKEKLPDGIFVPSIMVIVSLISYWILAGALEFEFLIEYERQNYANRLLMLAMLFALPSIGILFTKINQNNIKKSPNLILLFSLLISFVFTANVYAAYPRDDGRERSAGFNVSEADINAVWTIHTLGDDKDYIVLASQSLSAAALQEFGFYKYYNTDIFYYPIPTGGQMYSYYLQMADENPDRETMLEAMDLAGVDIGFFAIHDYWWNSERTREHAKQNADDWVAIGENEITIFIYYR